jgi:hypothetical protein
MATACRALPMDAVTAMIVAGVSIWLPTLWQMLIVNHRLSSASSAARRPTSSRPGSRPRCRS